MVRVGVGGRVRKTRTAAFVGCGLGRARDLVISGRVNPVRATNHHYQPMSEPAHSIQDQLSTESNRYGLLCH